MKAWLIDTYRNRDRIVIWLKAEGRDIRLEKDYTTTFYAAYSPNFEAFLKKRKIKYYLDSRKTYRGRLQKVIAFRLSSLGKYERTIHYFERKTRHRLRLYDADIPPEQMYLYEHDLFPCSPVELDGETITRTDGNAGREQAAYETPPLSCLELDFTLVPSGDGSEVIGRLSLDSEVIEGKGERETLAEFVRIFTARDPDVLSMRRAFSRLPVLQARLDIHNILCPFHRWDPITLKSRGGKSFFSYGNIVYRDYAVRLHGRLLVDTTTMIGSDCAAEGIAELCQLSGARFQHIASRSFGATFQSALVREMVRRGYLIPFKEKPVDRPMSMFELMKGDRVGHTLDSKTGFHRDVAELDFASMYPWIIYNHNISTETIHSDEPPFETVPGLPLKISNRTKGIVPIAIKPFLDRRMWYKQHPSPENKRKSRGLKWVLVTSYGYLRFREFKLGTSGTHMAIGAFAREALLKAVSIAEEHGFEVIHGIIDSLYLTKQGITREEVKALCREIELAIGIPLSFEGLFKWAVFLPSINDPKRPLPARYYGVFGDGEIKVRGIELRSKGSPLIVKLFQDKIIRDMACCSEKDEIRERIPGYARLLRETCSRLKGYEAKLLTIAVTLSKTEYKNNIPQRKALADLKQKGITPSPGQRVSFIYECKGVVLPEDYAGDPDPDRYRALISRSLYSLLEPFLESREELYGQLWDERQTRLQEFMIVHIIAPEPAVQFAAESPA